MVIEKPDTVQIVQGEVKPKIIEEVIDVDQPIKHQQEDEDV